MQATENLTVRDIAANSLAALGVLERLGTGSPPACSHAVTQGSRSQS